MAFFDYFRPSSWSKTAVAKADGKPGRPKGPRKEMAEIGYSGLVHHKGIVNEEFLRPLQGKRGLKVYREMAENDAVISAMLFAIERVMLQASWEVVAGDDNKKDEDAANFVMSCMNDMSHTWSDFIAEIMSMLRYGYATFEVVYKVRRGPDASGATSKEADGKIGWRKFAVRAQDTTDQWEFDENGGLRGMWQMGPPEYKRVFIPIEKLLLFRTRIEKNNPEGKSILRGAYRSWFFKKTFEELEGIGVERDLVGLPVLTPPEDFDLDDADNEDTKEWAKELITHVHRDEQEGILLPPGWKFELVGAPGKKQFDVDQIINRYDKRIAMSVLAQFILLGMDKQGSYALSENQSDLFMLSIIGWMNSITEVINRYAIPRLLELNTEFKGLKKPPRIQPVRITPPDLAELSNFLFKLARVGLVQPDEQLAASLRRMALLVENPRDRQIRVVKPGDEKPIPIMQQQPASMGPGGAVGDKSRSTAGGAASKKPASATTKKSDPDVLNGLDEVNDMEETDIARLINFFEKRDELRDKKDAERPAPQVNVNVQPPDVQVNVQTPDVHVAAPEITVNTPEIKIDVEKTRSEDEQPSNVRIERDEDGNITNIIRE